MSELSNDLRNQIGDKLRLWIHDSFELFDMGGIKPLAIPSIIHALLLSVSSGLVCVEASEAEAVELFVGYYRRSKASKDRRRTDRFGPMG